MLRQNVDRPVDSGSVPDQVRSSTVSSWLRSTTIGLLIMVGVTAGLCFFSDRDGYEGDDLSVLSAVYQLDAAKSGDLSFYRYAWQPLAYEVSSWVYQIFDSPDAVFLMAPLTCAFSIAILLHALSTTSRRLTNPLVHFALLVLLPELFYVGMFYNTTVLAMPTAALAVWLLTIKPGTVPLWRPILIGMLLAVSTLMRFDFLLMCPFFAAWLWIEHRSRGEIVALVLGSLAVVGVAAVFGMVDPMMLLKTLKEHHEEVNLGITQATYRWTWKNNVKVIAVMMHPLAWLLLLGGGFGLAHEFGERHGKNMLALLAISLVPMLYPMTTFVSVKYVIPLLMLLPFAMQRILERGVERATARGLGLVSWGTVAAGLLAALVSIEPAKRPPFVRLTGTSPKSIVTHDGARSFGAFAVALKAAGRDDSGEPGWKAAQILFDSLQSGNGSDLWIVANDSSFNTGRVSWRYLRTILARRRNPREVDRPTHFPVRRRSPSRCVHYSIRRGSRAEKGSRSPISPSRIVEARDHRARYRRAGQGRPGEDRPGVISRVVSTVLIAVSCRLRPRSAWRRRRRARACAIPCSKTSITRSRSSAKSASASSHKPGKTCESDRSRRLRRADPQSGRSGG